ncbi:MAG TPA: TonB-dependent receptor [Vicinamibacterales bacterium]|nr:TonB-dependent receptor [Vicinamibacterales bacterium]
MRFAASLCLVIVLLAGSVSAQQSPVTFAGRVVDASTRAPIATAVILVDSRQAVVDTSGAFTMSVTPGLKTVEVEAPGYFRLVVPLDISATGLANAELALARDEGFSASVDVVATSPAVAPATQAVAPIQVLRTPGALDNIFRTLQALPGVTATEEFGSRLAVRGGSPDQNLTVMDGVEVHDPYRLFGLTSAFNPETIQGFELATGGFSVKHGDRLSSLLAIENRDGTRAERIAGSTSLSITDVNVVTEGALPVGDGSWLLTARRTYFDVIAGRITDQKFPGFGDLQGKVAWDVGQGKKLSVFGLRSRQSAAISIDEEEARGEFNDDTSNDLAWARLDWSLGTTAQSRTIVGYSDTLSSFAVDATFENSSRRSNTPDEEFGDGSVIFERALGVRDTSLRQEFSWSRGRHVLDAGAEVHLLDTSLRFVVEGGRNPQAANGSSVQGGAGLPDLLSIAIDRTRAGAWLQDSWQIGSRASIQAGLRWDRTGNTDETLLSPRLAASLFLSPSQRIKGAVGRYTQSPGYEKLGQSDYLLDLGGPQELVSEKATHASLGFEQDLPGGYTVRAEGYYKRFSDLLVGQLETDAALQERLSGYDFPAALASEVPSDRIITSVPTNDGRGRAYGFDLFVSRVKAPSDARINGWASYTWGRGEREAYGQQFAFEYDRRHAFAAVISYRLSPKWEAATTTRVASGFPRTAPLGVRLAATEDTSDRDRDGNRDELVPAIDSAGRPSYEINLGGVSNLNRARLPVFARTDLRITWRPRGVASRWELYAEVINLLNRKNAGALEPRLEYDASSDRPRIVEEADQSIPRLPTIGVRFRF